MTQDYGHYQDWETGELDLVAVAAHAAAELDALERGVDTQPEALSILIEFLEGLGAEEPMVGRPLSHQLAMAINDAVQTSYRSMTAARSVSDVVREAVRVAAELAKASGKEKADRTQLRTFCIELSRAAMTPTPGSEHEESSEFDFRATA